MSDTSLAAASLCLVGAMDRLWFHHAVLLGGGEPISFPSAPKSSSSQPITDTVLPDSSLESSSKSSVSDHEESLSVTDEEKREKTQDEEEQEDVTTRPTRMMTSHGTKQTRSHSHSPKTGKCSKSVVIRYPSSGKRLDKAVISSCKTLEDLEQEEVRGFIDLGFRFNKEHISPKMISVVPGLQRINDEASPPPTTTNFIKTGYHHHQQMISSPPEAKSDKDEMGGTTTTTRPYLSEAWLIKRPDSPLLNVRVRRGGGAADMKKQLKFWARTVASEVQQES